MFSLKGTSFRLYYKGQSTNKVLVIVKYDNKKLNLAKDISFFHCKNKETHKKLSIPNLNMPFHKFSR